MEIRRSLSIVFLATAVAYFPARAAEELAPAGPDYDLYPPADAAACLADARAYFAEGSYAWALAAADELTKRWPDDNSREEADYFRVLCLVRLGAWSDLETALWRYADTYPASTRSAEVADVMMALYCARAFHGPALGYKRYPWEYYLDRKYRPSSDKGPKPDLEERRKAALAYAERVYGSLEKTTAPGTERSWWADRRALASYRYAADALARKYPNWDDKPKRAAGLRQIRRRLTREDLSADMKSALAFVAGADELASYRPTEREWRASGRSRIEYPDWSFEKWLARAREVWGGTIAAYGDAVGGRVAKAMLAHYDVVYLDEPARAAVAFDELAAAYAGTPGEGVFRKRAQDLRNPALVIIRAGVAGGGRRADVNVAARLTPEVTVTIYAADAARYPELYRDACDIRIPTAALPGLGEPLATRTIVADGPANDPCFQVLTASWDDLPYGLYVADARAGDAWSRAIFTVTDAVAITANDGERAYIQVEDAAAGDPLSFKIASAKLIVSQSEPVDGAVRQEEDGGGIKSIEPVEVALEPAPPGAFINVRDYPASGELYLNIETPRGPVLMASSVGGDGLPDTALTGALYTDQPLYRPGTTVNYKGVLRRIDYVGKEVKPAAGVKVQVDLEEGGRRDVPAAQIREAVTDEFGTFAGEYDLEATEPLGDKSLTCTWGAREYEDRAERDFKVGEYVKPEGGLTCTPGKERYVAGEKAIFTVNGRYFTGEPMAGEIIHYFIFTYENTLGVLAEGNSRLDRLGNAKIAVHLPVTDEWGYDVQYDVDLPAYTLTQNRTYGRIEVAGADRKIWLHEEGTSYAYSEYRAHRADEFVTLTANVGDLNRKGVAAEVAWAVYEAVEGFEPPINCSQPLAEGTAIAGADGKAAFSFRLTDPPELVAVIATVQDTRGRSVTSPKEYVNFEPATARGTGFLAVEVNDHYPAVADVLTVTVTSSLEPGPCVVFAAPDERPLKVWNLTLEQTPNGSRAELKITVSADFAPEFQIEALALRNGDAYEGYDFVRPQTPAAYAMTVTCTPDKTTYRPGDDVAVTVSCADGAGAPLKADISLAAVDEALLALEEDESRRALDPFKNALDRFHLSVFETSEAARGEIVKVYPALTYYVVPRDLTATTLIPAADKYQSPAMDLAGEVELETCPNRNLARPLLWLVPENQEEYNLRPASDKYVMAGPKPGVIIEDRHGRVAGLGTGRSPGRGGIGGLGGLAASNPIRGYFADSAFWAANLRTDDAGNARATFTLPDNLTKWRLTAVAVDNGDRVGSADAAIDVRKDVVAALEAPTHFVTGDRARVSAFGRNFTGAERRVRLGLDVAGAARAEGAAAAEAAVAAGREATLTRYVEAGTPGEIELVASAETDVGGDAVVSRVPVYERGVRYRQVFAGRLDGDVRRTLTLPPTMDPATFEAEVSWTPSIAALLRDGLPYYRDNAGASTEQILNGFRVNAELAAAAAEIGLDESSLTAGLNDAVRAGYRAISQTHSGFTGYRDLNLSGWPWFPGAKVSPYMTAYVVDGLWQLRRNRAVNVAYSYDVVDELRAYGCQLMEWLKLCAVDPAAYDTATVLYLADVALRTGATTASDYVVVNLAARCYERRESTDAFSLALLASVYGQLGDQEKLAVVLRNLDNGARSGPDGTVYWGDDAGWRWSDDAVETTAKVLDVKLTYEPDDPKIPRIVAWLVDQRRGAAWKSTKDSAAATLALIKYLKSHPETTSPGEVLCRVGGTERSFILNPTAYENPTVKTTYTAADVAASGEFSLQRLAGEGPIFYTISGEYYAAADGAPAVAGSITLERRYYLVETRVRNGKIVSRRRPLDGPVKKGEIVEVELRVNSPYDFDFAAITDPKPAGFAYPEGLKGFDFRLNAYIESANRERRLLFERLPRGETVATYRLRAAVPGTYIALPASITGVYSPDVGANTAAATLEVVE